MFDANGEFMFDHDLESGVWDGHSYDCGSPDLSCSCDPEAGLAWLNADSADDDDDAQDDFEDEEAVWLDYYEYLTGR